MKKKKDHSKNTIQFLPNDLDLDNKNQLAYITPGLAVKLLDELID